MRQRIAFVRMLVCLLFVLVPAAGCTKRPATPPGPAPSTQPGAAKDPAPPEKAEPAAEKPATAAPPRRKIPPREDPSWERVTGAFIIVCHVDAPRKRPGTTRTRAEAFDRAREAHARLSAPGVKFEAVAREYSDGPKADSLGGRLAVVSRDTMDPAYREFYEALFRLQMQQISPPFETAAGVAIVQRLPIQEYAAVHVWIQYAGAVGANRPVTRTREEARQLAEKVRDEADAPGTKFADIVRLYSEDTDRLKGLGGFMGIFSPASLAAGPHAPFGEALFRLEIGQVSDVVESPYGFHVLSRAPTEAYRVRLCQILVQHRNSTNVRTGVERTRDEARKAAEDLLRQIDEGKDFLVLAEAHSDDPSAKKKGHLGYVEKGMRHATFDATAFALEVGGVSDVIESDEGFHILWRLE